MPAVEPKQEDELNLSDYDEHSEDDEAGGDAEWNGDEEAASTPRRRRGNQATAAAPGYMAPQGLVKGALLPYVPMQLSTFQIDQMIHHGEIRLDADYQREVVWPEHKQIGLIDSLLHNFYIPPVLFAVSHSDDGMQIRTCIDGKQRLTSIHQFMNGSIPWRPLSGPGKGRKYWYRMPSGMRPAGTNLELPRREKALFKSKPIQCAEFMNIPEEAERDIFQRVQLGMQLMSAEKLQAISSPWTSYVQYIMSKWIYGANKFDANYSKWNKTRARDFHNLTQLLMFVEDWPKEQLNGSQATLTKFLKRVDQPEAAFKARIERIMEIYLEIVVKHQKESLGAIDNILAPIEFAFAGLVIHVLDEYYTVPAIAVYIGQMRISIRSKHKDVRTNTAVIKSLYQWLTEVPRPTKRRRVVDDSDEEDDEYGGKRLRAAGSSDGDFRGPGLQPEDLRTIGTRGVNAQLR